MLGKPDLAAHPSFQNKHLRKQNRVDLDQKLAQLTELHDKYKLFHALQSEDISAMPLLGPSEVVKDPHFVQRGTFINVDHPVLGKEVIFGPMWRQTTNRMDNWRHAPLLGQHTSDVLSNVLGMSQDEIQKLVSEEALV